jgi:hypothetical protein
MSPFALVVQTTSLVAAITRPIRPDEGLSSGEDL